MRPVLYPDKTIVLPPRLCATVGYYACAWMYGNYEQDWSSRFDKREKDAHRFTIADTHGKLSLTVPIAKPESSSCSWKDICVSTHGAWWNVHRVALESAYGRTPYFEFYIDRFLPMLTVGVEERYPSLASLALAWDAEIRKILTLSPAPEQDDTTAKVPGEASAYVELGDSEKLATNSKITCEEPQILTMACEEPRIPSPEYYQVRAEKLGFIPNLSILDLIFNLGPESPLYLHSITTDR